MTEHGRRATDKGWRVLVRENWYRDVWLFIITAASAWAVLTTLSIVADVQQGQRDVQEGRRFAVSVNCAATSAVIEAGRATITGGAAGVGGEFERNLERLGYPPRKVRKRQAKQAGRAYAAAIARQVEKAAGVKGVVHRDGTLDCPRLTRLARAR